MWQTWTIPQNIVQGSVGEDHHVNTEDMIAQVNRYNAAGAAGTGAGAGGQPLSAAAERAAKNRLRNTVNTIEVANHMAKQPDTTPAETPLVAGK